MLSYWCQGFVKRLPVTAKNPTARRPRKIKVQAYASSRAVFLSVKEAFYQQEDEDSVYIWNKDNGEVRGFIYLVIWFLDWGGKQLPNQNVGGKLLWIN